MLAGIRSWIGDTPDLCPLVGGGLAGEPGCVFPAGGSLHFGFDGSGFVVAGPWFRRAGKEILKKDHRNFAAATGAVAFAGLDEQRPFCSEPSIVGE